MEYELKSVCCKAQVLPDGTVGQLYCSKCHKDLGDTPWNNPKVLIKEKETING